MSDNYILDGHAPVHEPDILKWASWFEQAGRDGRRVVKKTRIGNVEISTVFLGLDHRFGRSGPPLLFETMIFGGEADEDCWRYATWEQAEGGHEEAVALVKAMKE